MKKIIMLIVAALWTMTIAAQFKATPYGIATTDGKDYYIASFDSIPQKELYNRVENYIMENYNSPDKVSSKKPYDAITLHTYYECAFYATTLKAPFSKSIDCGAECYLTVVMKFKDGKIRFDIPGLRVIEPDVSFTKHFGSSTHNIYMFKDNGEVKNERIINSFNEWINEQINNIINFVRNGKQEEDW